MKLLRVSASWLIGLGLLSSCALRSQSDGKLQLEAGYCDPPQLYSYDSALAPLPAIQPLLDSAITARYSRRNLLIANAAGVLPTLKVLVQLERAARQQPTEANKLATAAQRQKVLAHLQLMTAAIASTAAELDCEGERADQVAGYLAEQESQRAQRLTVLSIGVGAAAGVGTTVFERKAPQYAFGIGGGLLTAGLGLLTLTSHRKIAFAHPRNLLTDVWTEKHTSALYPPSVWYCLQQKAFSNRGETSVAHNTRQRWQHYGQLAQPDSPEGRRQQALFFGEGGTYSMEELRIRANMLNELQAAVRLINQDLQALLLMLTRTS
ncbi:hypothetical protein [Hymenobacter cavernae]|uniref:Uncharacterized protein n=1 Tax=Hymenobacter cavernae TaxID=2044852 RepID=A0ABQ1TGB1_9BACT|nr:hypothetical protein [Hymenobacter cavernae]GGE94107.1 hypothetical protein GCM10011383_01020 [Hymenobacter cavernae]